MDNIDFELADKILGYINSGKYSSGQELEADSVPQPDGKEIIGFSSNITFTLNRKQAEEKFREYRLPEDLLEKASAEDDSLIFSQELLETIGLHLIPYLSYGVLNGGMATSYGDVKNNCAFNPELFSCCEKSFHELSMHTNGRPKGITPAYINPDGTPGLDFMELKFRAMLLNIQKSQTLTGRPASDYQYSTFQMSSHKTDAQLSERYSQYRNSPALAPLIRSTGVDVTQMTGRIQPLIPAFTHTEQGFPLSYFRKADGSLYPLPGGHGQNFFVLKDVYKMLLEKGKKFVYLGNVDNIGFTPSPAAQAILALSGEQAGFDFSFKTPVDVKGGILVREKNGRLNCGDIGRAISKDFVRQAEEKGTIPLFNCATGLFNLEYLVNNLDRIIDSLPVRLSNQNKDAGRYSQAEQITWEIIGLLDDFMIFAVEKSKRFISSKLLMENMLTSGLPCCMEYLEKHMDTDFARAAINIGNGLKECLETQYAMRLENGKWMTR
ncbi:MAG: UTP--glucose-1-phosphate uridylyltransferase [Spirochaetia bacterium]|nr:UTP--glucose-1-phosphate uridylyltransferase [Spirochaetia bacterium]